MPRNLIRHTTLFEDFLMSRGGNETMVPALMKPIWNGKQTSPCSDDGSSNQPLQLVSASKLMNLWNNIKTCKFNPPRNTSRQRIVLTERNWAVFKPPVGCVLFFFPLCFGDHHDPSGNPIRMIEVISATAARVSASQSHIMSTPDFAKPWFIN